MSDLIISTAKVEIEAVAGGEKPARISALAYSGGVLPIDGSRYIIALDGLTIPATIPLLCDHENQVAAIIGSGRPEKRNGSLYIEGTLARGTTAADQVIALAKAGVELGVSVGVEPEQKTYVVSGQSIQANGKTFTAGNDGLILVLKSNLREVSIVPVGADRSATAKIAASSKGKKMSDQINTDQVNDQLRAQLPENQPGITTMERVEARWNRERWHDPTGGPHERAHKAMLSAAAGRIDFETFERELLTARLADAELRAIRAERPSAPAIHAGGRDHGGDGKNILAAASMLYLGRESLGEKSYGAPTMQAARDLGLRNVFDLARYALHEKGVESPPHGGEAMLKAAFSTTGLPVALGDSAGKIALHSYNEQPATWRSWVDVVSVADFKSKKIVRLGHTVGLDELGAAGEIKHGVLSETTAEVQAATFARMIAIPRQLLINDDLGLIPQVASDFGKLAMRKVANLVYTALLANPSSFFHDDNSNLTDIALSAAGLSEALRLFRAQVDADGEPLDIRPAVLLVCPTLESTARQLLNSEQLQRYVADGVDNQPSGNPFSSLGLNLEVEPRLEAAAYSGYSATGWYLLGPPAAQLAVVAFLNGMQGPTVESADTDFSTLGQQWRAYIDIGSALVDPKAGVFSSGDAE